jgi:cob(I)alamin adenosyltransferase
MKIYTRTGDAGETALFGGGRVSKDHPRVAAYGTVDELNASLGVAAAASGREEVRERLGRIQHDLFALGALLSTPPPAEGRTTPKALPEPPLPRIREMEAWIDEADAELPELHAFILPGGAPAAAALHLARTVCRRAERAVVHLAAQEAVEDWVLVYVNRLSDLLFTFARLENLDSGGDVEWHKERSASAGP